MARLSSTLMLLGTLVCIAVLSVETGRAQSRVAADTERTIPAELTVKGVGTAQFELITRGQKAYLPLLAIFRFLHLKAEYSPQTHVVEGFIVSPDNAYRLDPANGRVQTRDTLGSISDVDYIAARDEFYLRDDLFGPFFHIKLEYKPRKLTVEMNTKLKLPIFIERERARARARLFAAKGLVEVERQVPRSPLFIGGGRFDYDFSTITSSRGLPRYAYALHLGNQFLGGDLQTEARSIVNQPFGWDNVTSRLQYAFLDNSTVRQVLLGDIFTTGILPINVFGVEVTNRPAPRRIFFGEDQLSDYVGAKQTADFYQGALLAETQVTPSDGNYQFTTILPYGVSTYQVRSYDEYGIEQIKQYRIMIPPTLLPANEVQYSIATGFRRSSDRRGIGDFALAWGVSPRLTIGGGIDFSNAERSTERFSPSLNATARLGDIVNFSAMVSPTAFSSAGISAFYPSLLGGSLSYTQFSTNPFYNTLGMTNEKTVSIYVPLYFGVPRASISMFVRQTDFFSQRQWAMRGGLAASFSSTTIRILQSLTWTSVGSGWPLSDHRTDVTLFSRIPADVYLRIATSYDYLERTFQELRLSAIHRILTNASLEIYYVRNFLYQVPTFGVQVTLPLWFATVRGGISRVGGDNPSYSTSGGIRGSVGYASETRDFVFDRLSRIGYGGIFARPFVDANGNDVLDPGEEEITKAKMRATSGVSEGGRLNYTSDVGFGLMRTLPYEKYVFTLDSSSLENPLWVPQFTSFSVVSEPDRFRVIDLPIVMGGIVRGQVEEVDKETRKPVPGISVKIESQEQLKGKPRFSRTMTTYSTGEYEFIGVPPGRYAVSVAEDEVARMGRVAEKSPLSIEVASKPEGDEVGNVNFLLK